MALIAYNKTGSAVALAAGTPVQTIPASSNAPNRGPGVDVTAELRPDATVDATNGITGGVDAAGYAALQAQAASIDFEWTGDAEYETGSLVVGGPSAGISFAAPSDTGSANAEGSASTVSRSDHVHAIGDDTLTPAKDAVVDADGLGAVSAIRVPLVAGGGGSPDDVEVYNADAPFDFRVLDVYVVISTNVGGSTVTLRDASGGAGSALSDALDSGAGTGVVRNASVTATGTVSAGGSLYVRRSDDAVAGELIAIIQKI